MGQFLIKYKWKLLGTLIGAIAGLMYWYFIGCTSGTCPIQSHWQSSVLYGAFFGYIIPKSPKNNNKGNAQEET